MLRARTFGGLTLRSGHERDNLIYFLTQHRASFQTGAATPGESPWREDKKIVASNDLPPV